MKTFRFREFEVYKDAKRFRKIVQKELSNFPSEEKYGLQNQIDRACNSILLNIAEGSAKKSDKDFARYLEMALASANEVVAGFDIALDDSVISEEIFDEIIMKAESITKQLGGFIKQLLFYPKYK